MTSANQPSQQSSYVIDAENVAEMARLTKQAHLLTGRIGLFPPQVDPSHARAILDIGCGPGEWVLNVATQFPRCQVIGIDISHIMTSYASIYAQTQEIHNADFRLMDARQPLDFPDSSFDLIHMRVITTFLSTTAWPALIRECFRLLRPGGIICSTEFENICITTSPSMTRFNVLFIQALRQAGCCFTSEGDHIGITAVQPRLLRDAGFTQVRLQPFAGESSTGTPIHAAACEDYTVALKLLQPFLVHSGLATQEELDVLYERAMSEIYREDFCAVGFVQTVWGEKSG